MANELQAKFRRAVDAFQARDLAKAEKILEQIRRSSPNIFDVEHFLGVIKLMQGRFSDAEIHLKAAVALNGNSDEALSNCGYALKAMKRPEEALAYFTRALAVNPRNPVSYHNRGSILAESARNYSEAIDQFDKAIIFNPNFADAYSSKGHCLEKLRRYVDALVAYDKALSIKPDLETAWLGRGNVLRKLKRYDEALATYGRALSVKPGFPDAWVGRGDVFADLARYDEALAAYDEALSIKPDFEGAWVARGNVFWSLKRYDKALPAYDKALSIWPDLENAWLGRGNLFYDLQRHDEAFADYERALSIRPDLAEAWLGKGNALTELKRYDGAFAAYDLALSIKPDLAEAWLGRGNLFIYLKRHDEAFAALDKALSIKPDLNGVEGARLYAKMNVCDWSAWEDELGHLLEAVRAGKVASSPLVMLSLTDEPEDHLRCAKAWVVATVPPVFGFAPTHVVHERDKIRVGYVSPDFRQHPVAQLTAGVFENHDTNRFETYAFSIGPNDNSDLRKRLEGSFHCFIDCQDKNDHEILEAIKDAQIDILVDLAGHTQNNRLALFASHPAPIVVNFLGFAGTLGSKNLSDYIIADRTVVPETSDQFFEEKVVRLPGCFMPRDTKWPAIDGAILKRAEHGLPEDGIVFCCFNNAYKINRPLFGHWMNILKKVDRSVLWLSNMAEAAKSNLRNEAYSLGVDPDRLVFARFVPTFSDHLARHRLADLFLDALPYNAHTTASDALWAGLPVLTQIGNSFAGRVGASLLNAFGLPELITRTGEEYEALAVELALDTQKLHSIGEKLRESRSTAPLLDATLYTKHLEAAFEAMHHRHRTGQAPDHIEIRMLG